MVVIRTLMFLKYQQALGGKKIHLQSWEIQRGQMGMQRRSEVGAKEVKGHEFCNK